MPGPSLCATSRLLAETKLDTLQRKELRHLLALRQELRHPGFANAARGLEGMLKADRVLKAHDARGILIGGLSEAVWNRRTTAEELAQHKDVDVLVLPRSYRYVGGPQLEYALEHSYQPTPLEEGIDWWLPDQARLTVRGDYSSLEGDPLVWWTNANEVLLKFSCDRLDGRNAYRLDGPGLYLPDHGWILSMRDAELRSSIADDVQVSEEAFEAAELRLEKGLGALAPVVAKAFEGQVIGERLTEGQYLPAVGTLDLQSQRAINAHRARE